MLSTGLGLLRGARNSRGEIVATIEMVCVPKHTGIANRMPCPSYVLDAVLTISVHLVVEGRSCPNHNQTNRVGHPITTTISHIKGDVFLFRWWESTAQDIELKPSHFRTPRQHKDISTYIQWTGDAMFRTSKISNGCLCYGRPLHEVMVTWGRMGLTALSIYIVAKLTGGPIRALPEI